ncbi:MAG: Fe-S cluster assembly ATPase SufC [Erysipelotrichaceae bacterium]|nr:Fe-S cluster assembly ATPase SufC [Erysipelotrichaceae bacterium]
MRKLVIKDLHVAVGDKEILKGIDLTVNSNEVHALMGPNGNGKSTLLNTLMGHPNYKVTQGEIYLDGQDVLSMSVDQRSKAGLFLALQYPSEISGVTNSDFLKAAVNAHRDTPVSLFKFIRELDGAISDVKLNSELAHRYVNEGFSGGEKKRNEIIQMKLLKPDFAMLDEIDSGLDVDAIKIVADNIINLQKETNMALIIVSHYERFYNLVNPTYAHVLVDGRIIAEGDKSLVDKIDAEGYNWLLKEKNISLEQPKKQVLSLGSCANNRGQ